ncbi:MAG: hypothetical protein JW940_27225 [Polyangiaceae bacterium]|nr:hypothetical protein [Polyangiaceae bacterium]
MPLGDNESARLVTIRLSPATHKALRMRVAEDDTTIQQWLETMIERALGLVEPPNPKKQPRATKK